jgi:ferric-dicitrate binding protein FerR (iron transport regulator)
MEKINSIIEISELIARDIGGQLSQQEKEHLKKWIGSSEQNRKLYEKIVDGKNLAERNIVYESIDAEKAWKKVSLVFTPQQQRRRIVPILFRYAAAILILVFLGVTSYWLINEKQQKMVQPIAGILPGTTQAVLILANGENVNLSNDSTIDVIEKDGTVIRKSNKELNYAEQVSKNPQKPLLNTLIVPKGGEYSLVLSDGTRVIVNSMTKLVYPVSFTGDKREITLEGEAYFEVFKDKSKPFIVNIKGLQVEVLGTSFNVKAYSDDKQSFTTLVEGKVKLNSVLQTSVVQILEPDQQAVFDPSTSAIFARKVDARQFIQWTTGKYTFTNQPLDEMMKTLARWYDFNYQFEEASLKNIRFEGGLNKYQSIDPILEIINKTGKVKVSVKGKEVLFSKI